MRVGEQCTGVSRPDSGVTSSAWCSPVIISGSRWARAKSILSLSLLSRLSLICWILIIASSCIRALILTLTYTWQRLRGWLLLSTWWALSQSLVSQSDLARDESATLGHWVTGPGESGQVRVKGYLHFTGDGRLCHDYVTSPVTMSHRHTLVTSVRGPGGHKMVSSSHTQHMTLGSIAVNPLCIYWLRALHKHI